jgi:hypothetical protein
MAGKKVKSIDDSLIYFKEVMQRASLTNYTYVNNNLVSINKKSQNIVIIPDIELWNMIMDDKDLKENIKEASINDDNYYLFKIIDIMNMYDLWLDIDPDTFNQGKNIEVKIADELSYQIFINKNIFPIRLRKAELNNLSYIVFWYSNNLAIAIKKYFPFELDGKNYGFTVARILSIIK